MPASDVALPLKLLIVFIGSGLGGAARYLVALGLSRGGGGGFPFGTLVVNLVGCFAIGIAMHALVGRHPAREELRLALTVGLLGGFTTFSAFGYETFAMLSNAQPGRAAAYVIVSVVGGLLAVWAGYRLVAAA